MGVDRSTLNQLRRYATAFREARERGANESDTVMFIVKFIEEVLGWDSFKGEVSKETAVKDRYCDIGLKIDGVVQLLVECKAAGLKELTEKHIEQAENYASRSGIVWVLLTNGIEWKLFHLTFEENEGITHDLACEVRLSDDPDCDLETAWERLSLLSRAAVAAGALDDYWTQRKALGAASVVRSLFSETVLMSTRRELSRHSSVRLELSDVFAAVRDVLSREALLLAGDIGIINRRKRRKRTAKPSEVGNEPVQPEQAALEHDAASQTKDTPKPADAQATPSPAVPIANP